jgi:transcriptional regulator with XRE-family HTH domain
LKQRLSQHVLADEAGVTQALVSAIDRGRANPTVENLERLALVLGGELFEEGESRR